MVRPDLLALTSIVIILTGLGLFLANFDIQYIVSAILVETSVALFVGFLVDYLLKRENSIKKKQANITIVHYYSKMIQICNAMVTFEIKISGLRYGLEELLNHHNSAIRVTESFAGIFTAYDINQLITTRNSCVDLFKQSCLGIYKKNKDGSPVNISLGAIFDLLTEMSSCDISESGLDKKKLRYLLVVLISSISTYITSNELEKELYKLQEFKNIIEVWNKIRAEQLAYISQADYL